MPSCDLDSSIFQLFTPIHSGIECPRKPLKSEFDTGASVTLISEETYKNDTKHFRNLEEVLKL